jgi:hypothetical protein
MIQTLSDVFTNREELLGIVDKRNDRPGSFLCAYDRSVMDGVVVLPDLVAQKFLEINYLLGTHFAPGYMPGIGMSTGDVVDLEGKTFLTFIYGVLVYNVMTFHMIRKDEKLYQEWEQKNAEFDRRVLQLIGEVRQVSEDCFGIGRLKESRQWNETYVGWKYLGVPDKTFVEALKLVADACNVAGSEILQKRALALAAELQPYTVFQDLMAKIREECHHKGFPIVRDGMLVLNAPAASGGASVHTNNAGDDLRSALPNQNDFLMVGGQAGTLEIAHIGGGKLQGESYIMLPPQSTFFADVKAKVDSDEELKQKWAEVSHSVSLLHASDDWTVATMPCKQAVVKEIVPGLIQNRVLGFHLDLMTGKSTRTMHLRPVIAEAAFLASQDVISRYGCDVLRRNWQDVLIETSDSYGKLRSVFDAE